MREINECTAEVFRRSEKRIKERKRKDIIMTLEGKILDDEYLKLKEVP